MYWMPFTSSASSRRGRRRQPGRTEYTTKCPSKTSPALCALLPQHRRVFSPICHSGFDALQCTGGQYFIISREALFNLNNDARRTPDFIAAFSFVATQASLSGAPAVFDVMNIEDLLAHPRAQNPAEQCDNLILYAGARSRIGAEQHANPRFRGIIGAYDETGFQFIVREVEGQKLIDARDYKSDNHIRLTLKGWGRYEELKKGKALGKKVLMAMQYGLASVNRAFTQCFQPAVKSTGFDLYRLADNPKPGIIDNHLTVALLTSRFVVADLTENNSGAYWEAGFAEGQGKPVFYTCENSYFKSIKTHFDTNHRQTIRWEDGKWDVAIKELKDTIRNTLTLRDEVALEDL